MILSPYDDKNKKTFFTIYYYSEECFLLQWIFS